jgi:hypothetical protein
MLNFSKSKLKLYPLTKFSAIKHAGQATNDHIRGQAKDPEAFNKSITEVSFNDLIMPKIVFVSARLNLPKN